ncbi:PREDICTED: vomeronasal type-1 receptor 4-like [Nanorana parkeri]|uniref:vomeronasal type-1 receptor 4-like n=1 Tax=Nanorana parkeri TaxID=125878 RepID=UPI00085457A7|nr:PREDICTED: vomeronasal type-1 receptor 4-like [Nanorana parkeri]
MAGAATADLILMSPDISMDTSQILKAAAFMLLMIIGIPGNVFILVQFTYLRIKERKLLSNNIILTVMSFNHFLIVIARVIPQTLNALGVENLFDDSECKVSIYTYRVNRAMSICVTCLLSCHQCILIAPMTGLWVYLKQKVSKNLYIIILVFCITNLSIYPIFVMNAHARKNTSTLYSLRLIYCDADFVNQLSYIANGIFYTVRDLFFVTIMIVANSYIVLTLFNHEKSMRKIKSLNKPQRRSSKDRASRVVVLLVAHYVVFFGLDISLWIYTLTLPYVSTDINDIRVFVACCYASLSPIVIITTNPKLQITCLYLYKQRHSPNVLSSNNNVYCITA